METAIASYLLLVLAGTVAAEPDSIINYGIKMGKKRNNDKTGE